MDESLVTTSRVDDSVMMLEAGQERPVPKGDRPAVSGEGGGFIELCDIR